MAYKSKNNIPKNGFYGETSFTPLIDKWRNDSSDNTPLTDNYVGLYRNVYDMISSDNEKTILNLKYDPTTNSFILTYADGSTEIVTLFDNYLLTASYSYSSGLATFVLNNGDIVKLDLNELKNEFYTKQEIDVKFEELNAKVEELYDIGLDGCDTLKWNLF